MDEILLKNLDKKFIKYYEWLNQNKNSLLTQEELEIFKYHWVRFAVSIGLLDQYYGNKEMRVLELGGLDASTKLISHYFPKWDISNYSEDLRKPDWNIKSNEFDLILNMEVVEHLTDQYVEKTDNPEYCYDYNGKFIYSGVINCLLESNRILKKEGRMFLSTPNGLSYLNMHKMLLGDPSHQWLNHIREYSIDELTGLFAKTGLKVNNFECVEVLCADWDFSYIDKVIKLTNAKKDNRWSNLFFDIEEEEKNKKEIIIRKNTFSKNKLFDHSIERSLLDKERELLNSKNIVIDLKQKLQIEQEVNATPTEQGRIIQEKNLLLKQKELQIMEINQKYESSVSEYNRISNSLGWRILRPIRLMVKLILRK